MILELMVRDFTLAVRGLGRSGFSAATVLTLTLGIAGTAVMFAVIDGVVLRPLPVRDQDRVIVSWKELRSSQFAHYPFGGPDVEVVIEGSDLIESGAGVTSNGAIPWVAIENETVTYVNGALVTGAFFEVLGVEPLLGRAFTTADDVVGAENVIVISYGLWRRRYGASPDTIGRRVDLGDKTFTIIGVMPAGLDYPSGVQIWRTVNSISREGVFGEAAHFEIDLIARLRPGVTIDQATAELAAFTSRLEAAAPPDHPRGLIPIVRPLADVMLGNVRAALAALFGAVALVLLIAAANVANLLLLRGEARSRELAVRAALGADYRRIISLLFAETLVLALAAGAAALVAAWWSLEALTSLLPGGLPRVDSIRIDLRVFVFTLGIAFATALSACIVPGLMSVRGDLVARLRTGYRATSSATGRRVLVAAQVGLAVLIVSGAGLVTRSLLNLQTTDLGLAADRLAFVDLVPTSKFRDPVYHAQFLDELVARLEGIAAIAGATPVNVPPFSGLGGWDVPRFTVAGQTASDAAVNPSLNLESVHPNYFRTFQIRIVRGRPFTEADRMGALNVAIVSEDVAARTWPNENPIGKRMKMGGPDSEDPWRTIVGIAAPTRYRDLTTMRPTLYLPAKQFLNTARMLVLRTTAPLDRVASLAREHTRAIDADVRVIRVAHFGELLDAPLARPRFNAFLVSAFGLAALFLASVGLYAVIAAYVRQRDHEIGVRVALGATSADVRRLVLAEAVRLAAIGAAGGLAGALVATRLLRGMLFEIDPLDPLTLAGAALLLIAAAFASAYLPMRRATRLDPAALLRSE